MYYMNCKNIFKFIIFIDLIMKLEIHLLMFYHFLDIFWWVNDKLMDDSFLLILNMRFEIHPLTSYYFLGYFWCVNDKLVDDPFLLILNIRLEIHPLTPS